MVDEETRSSDMTMRVFVAGVGQTVFGRRPDSTLKTLSTEAVLQAVDDAGTDIDRIEAAYFANAIGGSITGQEMIAGQVALRSAGLAEVPVFNVENACASASSALHLAAAGVASGTYDVVLAVGAEKMSHPDKRRTFAAIGGAADVDEVFGPDGPSASDRSYFMDLYASNALAYMAATECTVEDLAAVVVKNQAHGARNPRAQYGSATTIEAVLAARPVVEPFTVPMCSPVSDGAAALVLVSETVARQLDREVVEILASVVVSGSRTSETGTNGSSRAAARAYARAGVGPQDLDMVEVHDATASAELLAYEDLGLCERGGAPALVRSGATALGGRVVVNPSGGLLAKGHPIGATGIAQVVEATDQILGRAGDRQVPGARTAMTHNAGGWVGHDNGAVAVTIVGGRR